MNNYEIIIADNNSSDSTAMLAQDYARKFPRVVKYLFEGRQGVHFARNSAAKVAQGNILYFTDDDMIADRNLLREILKVFDFDPKVACATGRVLPKWEITPPDWILSLCNNWLLSLNDPEEEFIISVSDCNVFSCHQAILADVFFQAGGFNPENTAGTWIGDGETGLNIKIKSLRYKFGYNGASIIYHCIPPERMTQSYLNRRLANQGNCDSYAHYRRNKCSTIDLSRAMISHLLKIGYSEMVASIRFVKGDTKWRWNQANVFYFLSRFKYDARLLFDDSWRNLVRKDNWLNE